MAKKSKKAAKRPAKKAVKKTVKKAAKKAVKKAARKPAKKSAAKKAATSAPKKRTNIINPYLTFKGDCEAAFNFYRSVFGGQFSYVGRFKDMPPSPEHPMPAEEASKIMHISLPISAETTLMGSDSSEAFGHVTNVGNNFSISITASSQAEADKLYNGLSQGGQATMPMSKTFWGSYFGMLTDRFGIQWMVSYDERPM